MGSDGPELDGPYSTGGDTGGSREILLSISLVFFSRGETSINLLYIHTHFIFGIEKSDLTSFKHGFVANLTLKLWVQSEVRVN